MQMKCGRAHAFSGPVQVDAAANVKEDDELPGGGNAQKSRCVTERGGRQEGKTGKIKGGMLDPIYKEKGNRWVRKMRRPKNDYPAAWMPRFLGWLLKIRIC